MKTYLVGGAVRDMVMGITPKDKDYVVVGSTPEEMLSLGYDQVGADFPVFLHPETREEYALARTETKNGLGYNSFNVDFSPDITLEEDLKRRDLTINSMAYDEENDEIIDPFDGQKDIEEKILRKTSDHFADDPVRVLRLARFLARFGSEWKVDIQTHAFAYKIMEEESEYLVQERVWQEIEKSLNEQESDMFFIYMCEMDTFWFNCMKEATTIETFDAVRAASSCPPSVRYSMLCNNIYDIDSYLNLFKMPSQFKSLAILVNKNKQNFKDLLELSAEDIFNFLIKIEAFRPNKVYNNFLLAMRYLDTDYYKKDGFIFECFSVADQVKVKPFLEKGLQGKELGDALRQEAIKQIQEVKNRWKN